MAFDQDRGVVLALRRDIGVMGTGGTRDASSCQVHLGQFEVRAFM